jgi:hypothetical protein
MDLALALVEEDHGSRLALEVARDLVLYLRCPGGQSQFSVALSTQVGISQGAADHPGRVSAALSRREPPAGATGRQGRRQAAQRSSINPIQGRVAFTLSTLFFFPGWNKTNLA